ncbi:MAG: DUF4296 domain-containing protein [Bacteroidales bacterium]|nr:DUF4296 domain-containing protein [Bacteroidales bacterium]
MMRRSLILLLVSVLLISSCKSNGIIPKNKMADILSEMFLVDQYIDDVPEIRGGADTLFVYESIFNKYGYTSDDYIKSVKHYMENIDNYQKILLRAQNKLKKNEQLLSKQEEIENQTELDVKMKLTDKDTSDLKAKRSKKNLKIKEIVE